MIKDFNAFITEDKEYNEIFTLVEEVLSNEYSIRRLKNLLMSSICCWNHYQMKISKSI